jgi:hypothetical protein
VAHTDDTFAACGRKRGKYHYKFWVCTIGQNIVPVHSLFAANSRVGSCLHEEKSMHVNRLSVEKTQKKANYNYNYNKLLNKRIIQNGLV